MVVGCGGGQSSPAWNEAFDAEDTGWLLNVAGPAGDDLYAVGGAPDEGAIVRFDGTSWSPVDPAVDVPLLNWVHPFAADDLFMAGNEGTMLHFDGESYEEQPTPTDQDLWGVWGASPEDVWAVGGNGREEGQATILRFDGSEWTRVAVPELERPNVFAFFKVWGASASDVWIVGQRGAVLHWDGTELTEELVGTSRDLISVWGTSADRVAVVGGRSNGVLSVWNGEEWRTEEGISCDDTGVPVPGLNGVWMRQAETVHAVGVEGVALTVDFDTFECDAQFLPTERRALHAIFGDSSGRLTAVGGNLDSPSGPYQGVAFTRELASDE